MSRSTISTPIAERLTAEFVKALDADDETNG